MKKLWKLNLLIGLLLILSLEKSSARLFKPEPGKVFKIQLKKIQLLSPLSYRGLSIFPLKLPGVEQNILSFEQAARKNCIRICEIDGGRVNEVAIENFSSQGVFILAGEILTGCKQDRILQNDLLLPAHSGKIRVPAFCVEPGRWEKRSEHFSSGGSISPPNLRQMVKEKAGQEKVWQGVRDNITTYSAIAGENCRLDHKGSASLQRVYESKEIKNYLADYLACFKKLPAQRPEMNGVVVVINGEILCADLFPAKKLFSQYWEKMLYSYCLQAIASEGERNYFRDYSQKSRVEDFLSEAVKAGLEELSSPGAGCLLSLVSPLISGTALLEKSSIIHCDLYPREDRCFDRIEKTPRALYREYR